ncbi:DUF1702 family protein [Naumannella halotolerans]|uniref:Uncharacterized protein DUF1702 n=1 Tax=Naumannella halotolerans TaxID=993414 RepID=A0A4V6Q2A4_9ACTN|nr:DUF1702 family protein [Naumannella halotolerans]TDT30098.1 uncharacterized protein DUF1702 [Naumannella halotolerans]
MTPKLSTIARALLGLSADEFPKLAAQRVGDHDDMHATWTSFEPVAATLVDTFYLSLDIGDHRTVADAMDKYPEELRGIAYEGAGMGLMLRDSLLPWSNELHKLIHGPGAAYRCLIHIGAGLVLARLPNDPMKFINAQAPLMRHFVADGYGFFDGFFRWEQVVTAKRTPPRLHGYALNAYDQGVGRSLWFSSGANVGRIHHTVSGFSSSRQADLWSGVGLACAYAAGVLDARAIQDLTEVAGPYASDVATGVAVAAVFRSQSELTAAPHTDLASQVLWAADAHELAQAVTDQLEQLLPGSTSPDDHTYQQWRQSIAERWQQTVPNLASTRSKP